jgi:hypothetical protein
MKETILQDQLIHLAQRIIEHDEPLATLAMDHGVSVSDLEKCVLQYRKAMKLLQRQSEKAEIVPALIEMANSFI